MKIKIQPTEMMKRFTGKFISRAIITGIVILTYLFHKEWLDLFGDDTNWAILGLLWIGMVIPMLEHLYTSGKVTLGSKKQYKSLFHRSDAFKDSELVQEIHKMNRGAIIVAFAWLVFNFGILLLFYNEIIGVPEIILASALFYSCDLICVIFFCPFQTWFMKNRCCVTCRIYAWGSWMMVTPMIVLFSAYTYILIGLSVLIFIIWEYNYSFHPERFWDGTNQTIKCANCKEILCQYKRPRSPRFKNIQEEVKKVLKNKGDKL